MSEAPELSTFVRTGRLPMRRLETARLLLREFDHDDRTPVSEWEEVFQKQNGAQSFLDFCLHSYRKWGIGPWAAVIKQTGIVAGYCGFVRIHFIGNLGEVNYYIRPSHRTQGFASEALQAALAYGFADLDLNRIQARCSLDNPASERVMQKSQMKFERMIKSDSSFEGPASPQKLYAISRDAFHTSPL
jgi:[ribosomal protein S5]-alanine N-acetyltransferase